MPQPGELHPPRLRASCSALAFLALTTCAHAPHLRTSPGPLRGWDYEVRFDDALGRADVRVCFDGTPSGFLRPRAHADLAYADTVVANEADAPTRQGIALGARPAGACVRYAVILARAAADDGSWEKAARVEGALVTAPDLWLWTPRPLPRRARVTVRLVLPEGLRASVPWPRSSDGRYTLDDSSFRWQSLVVLGRLEPQLVPVPGGVFEVVRLGEMRAGAEGVRRWLTAAAQGVATLYGRFPREHTQIVIIAAPSRRGRPVRFGRTFKGGGAGVLLLTSDRAEESELLGDWIGIHELTHLGLPPQPSRDAWFSEGFVTYYTEVLRVRAGLQSEAEGWQMLHEGFGRGRVNGTGMRLVDESASMHETHSYGRVYWGGAAIALLADVRIRQLTQNARSLDTVMKGWASCCLSPARSFTAAELLGRVKNVPEGPLLRRLSMRVLRMVEFPMLRRVYAALGLEVQGRRVVLREDAPARAVRDAIMRR